VDGLPPGELASSSTFRLIIAAAASQSPEPEFFYTFKDPQTSIPRNRFLISPIASLAVMEKKTPPAVSPKCRFSGHCSIFSLGAGNGFQAGKIHYEGHWRGWAQEIETFLVTEMATSEASAIWVQKSRDTVPLMKRCVYESAGWKNADDEPSFISGSSICRGPLE